MPDGSSGDYLGGRGPNDNRADLSRVTAIRFYVREHVIYIPLGLSREQLANFINRAIDEINRFAVNVGHEDVGYDGNDDEGGDWNIINVVNQNNEFHVFDENAEIDVVDENLGYEGDDDEGGDGGNEWFGENEEFHGGDSDNSYAYVVEDDEGCDNGNSDAFVVQDTDGGGMQRGIRRRGKGGDVSIGNGVEGDGNGGEGSTGNMGKGDGNVVGVEKRESHGKGAGQEGEDARYQETATCYIADWKKVMLRRRSTLKEMRRSKSSDLC